MVVFPWCFLPAFNCNSFLKKVELRKIQGLASEARAEAQMKTKIAEAKKKYVSTVTRNDSLPCSSPTNLPGAVREVGLK